MATISALRTLPRNKKQNEGDQQHAIGQVAQNGVRGVMHQFAAVEVGNEFHSCRQQSRLAVRCRSVDRSSGAGRASVVSATAPLRSRTMPSTTSSSLRIVPSSLRMVFPSWPRRTFGACTTFPEIAHADRRAVLHFDDGGGDVVGGLHEADGANIQGLLAALDESAAGVDVVGDQRLLNLRQSQAVGNQLAGIELHLVFARGAAERIDINDVGDGLQLVHDEPVVERFQFHHVVLRIGAGQRVEHDLADRDCSPGRCPDSRPEAESPSAGDRELPGGH